MNITILSKKYKVLTDIEPHEGLMGQVRASANLIRLDKRLPPSQTASTLLHEVLHVLSTEMCIGLSEKQIRRVEAGLYDVLKNNPQLIKLIQEAT